MKTYCNARLSLHSPAHSLTQEQRSLRVKDWIAQHDDQSIIENSRRGRMGVNDGASLSVAFSIEPDQATRLGRLLDGRKHTLTSLLRRIFEEQA